MAEIAIGDYRDTLGQRLVQNTAYLEPCALLRPADLLEEPVPPPRFMIGRDATDDRSWPSQKWAMTPNVVN